MHVSVHLRPFYINSDFTRTLYMQEDQWNLFTDLVSSSQDPFCRAARLDNIQLLILDNQHYEILKDRAPQLFQEKRFGIIGSCVRQAGELFLHRVTSDLEVFAKIPFLNLSKTKSITLRKEPVSLAQKNFIPKTSRYTQTLEICLGSNECPYIDKNDKTPPPPHKEKHEKNHWNFRKNLKVWCLY